jgi:hypothetical protein
MFETIFAYFALSILVICIGSYFVYKASRQETPY